jgi:hypothetical protein
MEAKKETKCLQRTCAMSGIQTKIAIFIKTYQSNLSLSDSNTYFLHIRPEPPCTVTIILGSFLMPLSSHHSTQFHH